jgi:alkanesulfonate monooxygenase SsuD/methylene tetrahydromethanopterin reductase-like flavin-dependent oxidoreductase (luciferase family)
MPDFDEYCTATDEAMLANVLRYALVGSKETVQNKLAQFVKTTGVDEIIVSMPIYDIEARLFSVNAFAEIAS